MKSFTLFIMLVTSSTFFFEKAYSLASDSIPGKSTLTVAAVFANDASYYGQKAQQKNPYVAVAANYQLKSGFYFTAQSYKLLNDNTSSVSAAAVGAGVNFKLGKKLTTDLSYSHSFYPQFSPLLQAANVDNASFIFSYDGWIKPSLTGDYAFGKASDAFVTGALSKSINLFSITQKDLVTINPCAEVVGGTQHFYQTYVTQKKIHDSILGITPIPIFGNSSTTSHTDTVANTSFNILSYNFKLPLVYNRSHYVIQAEYQVSLLSNHVAATEKINSFLTFSFYYQF